MQVYDTHLRTTIKAIIYRVLSVIAIICLSLAFGASTATAGMMGLVVVIIGTTIYYIHERIWVKYIWLISNGKDLVTRSLIKTLIYRAITTLAGIIIAREVLTNDTSTAIEFAIAQAATNMILFFIVERIANLISWGRVLSNENNN